MEDRPALPGMGAKLWKTDPEPIRWGTLNPNSHSSGMRRQT